MLDVLEYNQLVSQYNTLAPSVASAITSANTNVYPVSYSTGLSAGVGNAFVASLSCSPVKQNNFGYLVGCALHATPWDCTLWANIPTLANTGGLRIFDSGADGNQGVCCAWTVPAGATYARFQIWGAGAASKGNLCCGMSMHGGTGAYASVILPVTPGCVYTLCSGCAEKCCYYCTQGTDTSGSGCASFVIGYGLNNFCADGGDPSAANWLYRAAQGAAGGIGGYCIIQNNNNSNKINTIGGYGHCMCGWGGFCWNNQCSSNDLLCSWVTSCRIYYGNVTNPTKSCHFVIGAPGMFNAMYTASTDEPYRYFQSPPLVNLTCVTCSSCYMLTTMGGGSCNGLYNQGAYLFPSRGGVGLNVCAGNVAYGGYGTGGLVCVTWTTAA